MKSLEMAHPSIAIVTPVRGGFGLEYVKSLIDLSQALSGSGTPWTWIPVSDRTIVTARNELAGHFLRTGCSHSLWIDADNGLADPATLKRMLEVDQPFVVLPCHLRRRPYSLDHAAEYNVVLTDLEQQPRRGAVRVEASGFGTNLIRREVFDLMAAAHPELGYQTAAADGGTWRLTNFFGEIIESDIRYSEDYSFCRRWRALGGEVWAVVGAVALHAGSTCNFGVEVWDRRAEWARARKEARETVELLRVEHAFLHQAIARARDAGVDVTEANELARATAPPVAGWRAPDTVEQWKAQQIVANATECIERVRSARARLASQSKPLHGS
ncbi:MAG TPA: hypothetical protein VEK07_24895 [Polyangiaceae bacterium]|nr:hypothetical protein [Polyangiaceae bacterium]